jgi:hypothetical protein
MEDNIITYLKEMGCEEVDWIYMARDRVQWMVLVTTVINRLDGEFIDQLSDYQFFQKDPASRK